MAETFLSVGGLLLVLIPDRTRSECLHLTVPVYIRYGSSEWLRLASCGFHAAEWEQSLANLIKSTPRLAKNMGKKLKPLKLN